MHSSNANCLIEFTLNIELELWFPLKKYSYKKRNSQLLSPNLEFSICESDEHLWNELDPISVTEECINISVNFEHQLIVISWITDELLFDLTNCIYQMHVVQLMKESIFIIKW